MTEVWTLDERYKLAAALVHQGMSDGEIMECTGLPEITVHCIRQRECPDFSDFRGLKKGARGKVE